MTAATAKIIDFSAYRRRREADADTASALHRPPSVIAWVPALILVPVLLVPLA